MSEPLHFNGFNLRTCQEVLTAIAGDQAEVSVQVPRAEELMFYKI